MARSIAPPTAGMASGAPVCQFARSPLVGDLERAEDADVEVAAAHHGEGVGVVEVGRTGQLGDRDLAGVDQVGVDLVVLWRPDPC